MQQNLKYRIANTIKISKLRNIKKLTISIIIKIYLISKALSCYRLNFYFVISLFGPFCAFL